MPAIEITYLSGPEIDELALSNDEILDSVRAVLGAQGRRETVIEPRMHLFPRGASGHFNVLRGATPELAGVKVVGDYVDNYRLGLPSELALLMLMERERFDIFLTGDKNMQDQQRLEARPFAVLMRSIGPWSGPMFTRSL